ncbi:DUF11 domain-containing protein [Pedococcus sp. P5_B7]
MECTYPVLPAGTALHDRITGTVDPALVAGRGRVNQAVTFSTTYDPEIGNNLSIVTSQTGSEADLEVTKVADQTAVTEGDTVGFTVTVVNNGPSVATGVEVRDTPTGMRATSHNASVGAFSGGVWKVGRLEVGERVTLSGDYRISGPDATNRAVATGDISDPVVANNQAGVQLRVSPAQAHTDDNNGDRTADLPRTGSPLGAGIVQLALALIIAGAGALLLSRRRRTDT